MTTIYASLDNMRTYADKGLFAYSPDTGEECSADASDYWYLGPEDVLEDENGRPMVLAMRGDVRIVHHEDFETSS
jgi:hypothetical protein